MSNSTVSGSCLCGAVRFSVGLPSLFCGHCHCSMCRRNHGAGFVTWFAVPRAQLEVQAGEGALRRYPSSTHGTRSFCGECGSSLFCESETHADQVDITLANVEAAIDRAPQFHFYFDSRAPWVEVSDDLPRLGGPTGVEPLKPIYHIVIESEFRTRLEGAVYRPRDLADAGFVHCALEPSVVPVANDYYSDAAGRLLLLEIEPSRLTSETRYEVAAPVEGGGSSHFASAPEFPHVYGPIETEAITRVGVLEKGEGGYEWPGSFTSLETFQGAGS